MSISNSGMSQQAVWIGRYGLRETMLVEFKGPFDMDISAEGVQHAVAAGKRLAKDPLRPSILFASPFRRAVHTAHVIAKYLNEYPAEHNGAAALGPVRVCVEDGLTEWLTPSLVGEEEYIPKLPQALIDRYGYDTIDPTYTSVNPYYGVAPQAPAVAVSNGGTAPRFPEDERELLKRMQTTIEALLGQVGQTQHLMIVSHAPCNLGVALALEGCTESPTSSQLIPWPLGGLTQFVKPVSSVETEDKSAEQKGKLVTDFALQLNGDTDHMPGEYAAGFQAWTLPCLS